MAETDPQPTQKKDKAKWSTYDGGHTSAQVSALKKDYIPGTSVVHVKFGRGEILSLAGDIAVILFDDYGSKKIALSLALQKELIRLAKR